ncbi:uncharacterized protein SCHCODRAFT_02670440 [Schizophyllum commune H4-8]|uniref:uncharacterized protein n=1 Tax=Schizophyllum commune (strain H4-8 / FGSC 9210) TaxID=578458 RepID=UPI00215EE1BF|nr:uncharacterized protein SCHCODRAFT_02670440 [Schizophyllum commune H4-8]KAI5889449.1 hypothetical protein SCHCODRAFT_02670440 [Schizophyllum commune H4-8]
MRPGMAIHAVRYRYFLRLGGDNLRLWLRGRCRVPIDLRWRGLGSSDGGGTRRRCGRVWCGYWLVCCESLRLRLCSRLLLRPLLSPRRARSLFQSRFRGFAGLGRAASARASGSPTITRHTHNAPLRGLGVDLLRDLFVGLLARVHGECGERCPGSKAVRHD